MTPAPVMTITAALLDELQQKAKAVSHDNLQYGNEPMYAPRLGLPPIEQEFAEAASPEVVDALVEHIRSLAERLEKAEKDAARYRYFRDAGLPNGLGLYDDELDAEIDQQIAEVAAIAQEGKSHE